MATRFAASQIKGVRDVDTRKPISISEPRNDLDSLSGIARPNPGVVRRDAVETFHDMFEARDEVAILHELGCEGAE